MNQHDELLSDAFIDVWKQKLRGGASVQDLLEDLVEHNTPTIQALRVLTRICSISLNNAIDIYDAHPAVLHKAAVKRCKEMIAAGFDKAQILDGLHLSGFSQEQSIQALNDSIVEQ